MSRQHHTLASLRPTAADFAAAAALHGPSLLLQLQAARPHGDQPPTSATPRRHRDGLPSSILRPTDETSGG